MQLASDVANSYILFPLIVYVYNFFFFFKFSFVVFAHVVFLDGFVSTCQMVRKRHA